MNGMTGTTGPTGQTGASGPNQNISIPYLERRVYLLIGEKFSPNGYFWSSLILEQIGFTMCNRGIVILPGRPKDLTSIATTEAVGGVTRAGYDGSLWADIYIKETWADWPLSFIGEGVFDKHTKRVISYDIKALFVNP